MIHVWWCHWAMITTLSLSLAMTLSLRMNLTLSLSMNLTLNLRTLLMDLTLRINLGRTTRTSLWMKLRTSLGLRMSKVVDPQGAVEIMFDQKQISFGGIGGVQGRGADVFRER